MTDAAAQPGMPDIMAAIAKVQGADRAAGIADLNDLWTEWAAQDAPVQQSTIAHFLADTEEQPEDELTWDARALESVERALDDASHRDLRPLLEAFLPSLHLNLADVHHRLGNGEDAHRHLAQAQAFEHLLADDPYGAMIRAGIVALGQRMAEA